MKAKIMKLSMKAKIQMIIMKRMTIMIVVLQIVKVIQVQPKNVVVTVKKLMLHMFLFISFKLSYYFVFCEF